MNHVLCLWHPATSRSHNVYVAFQAAWTMPQRATLRIQMFGCDAYRAFLDGAEFLQGPARFDVNHPEYDLTTIEANAGAHLITVIVHYYGVETRMTSGAYPAFLQCEISAGGTVVDLDWKCLEIRAYADLPFRVNEMQGWMECCDYRQWPDLTHKHAGEGWITPVEVKAGLPESRARATESCKLIPRSAQRVAEGSYVNRFSYEIENPPMRFALRDLASALPADGVWYRFDFGKVGLYYPIIRIDVPPGTVVEAGYSEFLTDNRVIPFMSFCGKSCFVDRWIADEGTKTLWTFSPRGFRYLELHISERRQDIGLVAASVDQRTYFDRAIGSFDCSDPQLTRIWQMCIDTLQACSEDALTDTPTRERGQWLGDAALVGIENLAVSFGDLSLIRRSLLQAAYGQRDDGMTAAHYPAQTFYIASFSMIWVQACWRYYQLSGDKALLAELYDAARKLLDLLISKLGTRGVRDLRTWDFLDWGHIVQEDELNISLNLLLLGALRDLNEWELTLGKSEQIMERGHQIRWMERTIRQFYRTEDGLLAKSIAESDTYGISLAPGYHATVLGLRYGMIEPENRERALQFIKAHILKCFPNNPEGQRLKNPAFDHSDVITPYFSHFALTELLKAGETEFVLDQFRVCWGWMIEQGATTLLEVFDPRWSHCHAWSGSPAWQLSRYVLGLHPEPGPDLERFMVDPNPGSLAYAEGTLPSLRGNGRIAVKWVRENDGWTYELRTTAPVLLRLSGRWNDDDMQIDGHWAHNGHEGEYRIVNESMRIMLRQSS